MIYIANPILLQLNKVATLLGTSAENVARVLTHRIVASKVEVVESKLSLGRARYTREALAKVRDNIIMIIRVHENSVSYKRVIVCFSESCGLLSSSETISWCLNSLHK